MTRALSVVALIDSPTPMAWVKQLIDRLDQRDCMDLHVVVTKPDPLEIESQRGRTGQPPASLTGRVANAILLGRIDKPLFAQNSWKPETLNLTLPLTRAKASTVLPHGDVINNDGTPTSMRVIRIATHALPRQSYSYTDLRRAAYFSLSTLFESRLVWLSRGADIVQTEYSQSSPLANGRVVDPERHAAHAHADWLANNGFLPPAFSNPSRLKQALTLWYHQSVDRIVHRLWFEQWQLGFLKTDPDTTKDSAGSAPTSSLAALTEHTLADFAIIDSPARTWWADPHLYQHDGALYVFFEEMQINADHGHLSVARLSDDRQAAEVTKILDDGQHLSYLFVFGADDDVYMIPETASRKSVLLYRAERFPDRWTLVSELLSDVDLADSTVHFDGEQWWMFTNAMSHRSIDERDQLHLYFAEDVSGPWTPHPMNPVVTGVDRARMAGSVIRRGDGLYRPSQYGAVRYGHGINLNRIDVLNSEIYAEVIVGRLLPETGGPWLGCHSITHANNTTILDRVSRHFR